MSTVLVPWYRKITKMIPALAFVGGFLWDSISLGGIVQSSDLWMLFGYWAVAFIALIVLGRDPSPTWQSRLTFVVQFCFGSLFSALVVFYFKSSGTIFTFLSVIGLIAILLANEFLKDRYSRLGLSWSLFCLSGTMYLNFLVPHIVHGIGFFWFLLSCILGFLPVFALWKWSKQPSRLSLLGPIGVPVLLLVAWMMHVIPPVPMVMKQNLVCKAFEKIDGEYTCLAPTPGILQRLGLTNAKVYHTAGEKLFVLSSVFAPSQIEAELEHRWFLLEPVSGAWLERGVVPFYMRGGRASGWRFYSNKQILEPGEWRVVIAVKSGAEISRIEFTVPEASEPDGVDYRRTILQ